MTDLETAYVRGVVHALRISADMAQKMMGRATTDEATHLLSCLRDGLSASSLLAELEFAPTTESPDAPSA